MRKVVREKTRRRKTLNNRMMIRKVVRGKTRRILKKV
jgi:hypothetical protein